MYAKNTKVPIEKTKAEIEKLLQKGGVDMFATMATADKASIAFRRNERSYRFSLVYPPARNRTRNAEAEREAVQRQKWRVLLLVIKAKLEAIESQLVTFEEEFLAQAVDPGSGKTVYELLGQQLISSSQPIPRLLGHED